MENSIILNKSDSRVATKQVSYYKRDEFSSHRNLGIIYAHLRQFDKAVESLDKALEIAKTIGDTATELECYSSMGLAYKNMGQFDKAVESLDKALEIAKTIGDTATELECYNQIGLAYKNMGQFDKAVESWIKL